MFSEIVLDLGRNRLPEPDSLCRRFDIAVTKKQGVVRLPPSFWVDDPKINPRTDHLFWAALLTGDLQRIELAMAVINSEILEMNKVRPADQQQELADQIHRLIVQFFERIPDRKLRREIRQALYPVIPEWLDENSGDAA
jgi:hypothetical protein